MAETAYPPDSNGFRRARIVDARTAITSAGPTLAIIVPTFKERDNISELVTRLDRVLLNVAWEVVFVDDNSPDGTSDIVRSLAQADRRVRVLHRFGRRGLSSAVVEGILSTAAPFVAVMDADLQHDESILAEMFAALRQDRADLVVGSRYVAEGSIGSWDNKRQLISRVATRLSRIILKTELADPMSGYFMMSRAAFMSALGRLSVQGYKILLDIVASSPARLRILELPYTFRERQFGESKLDSMVVIEYVFLLTDKMLGGQVPVRFVMFSAIGGVGVFVHMIVLAAMLYLAAAQFAVAQTVAMFVTMTFNFFLNNWLTYRDRRLVGPRALLGGLFSFYAVCGIGAAANVGIASALFQQNYSWWLAGIAGILISAVWNYATSTFFTWRTK